MDLPATLLFDYPTLGKVRGRVLELTGAASVAVAVSEVASGRGGRGGEGTSGGLSRALERLGLRWRDSKPAPRLALTAARSISPRPNCNPATTTPCRFRS